MTLEERFWAKVDRGAPDECWRWTGATTSQGYGSIRIDGRACLAHRVAVTLDGRDPGPECRHSCDTPSCVNPAHLLPGTKALNMRDMAVRERARSTKVTAELALTARARAAAGEYQRVIAADLGISQAAVSKIVRRQSWTHI